MAFSLLNFTLRSYENVLIRDVNFQFVENKKYFFFGRTGIGKSLLLDCLAGLYSNYSGEINFTGNPAMRSYLFQKNVLIPWLTVKENLDLVCKDQQEKYLTYLDKFNLGPMLNKKAVLLSGGETQVVNLIRALLLKPKIIFSDEPFSSVDYVTKQKSYRLLQDYILENSVTLFAVSHDLEEICSMADEVLYFDQKKKGLVKTLSRDQIKVQSLFDLLAGDKIEF